MKLQKRKFAFICFVIVSAALSGCNQQQKTGSAAEAPASGETIQPATANKVDKKELIGEWTRTDAPYQLKVSGLNDDGSLAVGYFNPKSIHVGKSNWKDTAGTIKIYVEMQDENYPGSNYSLFFIPGKNLLSGTYYQAVEGETFDVDFIRTK